MPSPLVYMVRADLTEDYVEDHHAWYASRHAPDNMSAGFWSVRGYDSATSPNMWNIYEVPDVAIFSSDAYNNNHKNDPFLVTAVGKLIGRTVSVYDQIAVLDAAGDEQSRFPTLRGPALTSLRFDSEADARDIEAWFRSKVVSDHAGVRGVRTVRLWEQRQAHPKWPTTEPRWSVGIEWESKAAITAANGRGRLEKAASDPKLKASKVKVDAVTKRYSLVREEVFGE